VYVGSTPTRATTWDYWPIDGTIDRVDTPERSRPRRLLVAGLGLLVASALLTVPVLVDPVQPLFQEVDDGWRAAVTDGRSTPATDLAEFLHAAGGWPWSSAVVGLIAIVCVVRGRFSSAVYVTMCVALTSLVVVPLLKLVVGRARPPDSLVEATWYSFPSGHTAFIAAFALSLAWVSIRRPGVGISVAVVMTALMMWSRTYLSVHWLTDTLAAALIGFGVALTVAWALGVDRPSSTLAR
ncbi:MAG: phosphatase PAP2 family protein, partial [Jiangellaceae bacterium]